MNQLKKICSVIQNDTSHVILKFGESTFLELSADGIKISSPSVTFDCPTIIANRKH